MSKLPSFDILCILSECILCVLQIYTYFILFPKESIMLMFFPGTCWFSNVMWGTCNNIACNQIFSTIPVHMMPFIGGVFPDRYLGTSGNILYINMCVCISTWLIPRCRIARLNSMFTFYLKASFCIILHRNCFLRFFFPFLAEGSFFNLIECSSIVRQ